MTTFYLEIARDMMAQKRWAMAETALRRSLGFANREKVSTVNIFRSLNYVRQVAR